MPKPEFNKTTSPQNIVLTDFNFLPPRGEMGLRNRWWPVATLAAPANSEQKQLWQLSICTSSSWFLPKIVIGFLLKFLEVNLPKFENFTAILQYCRSQHFVFISLKYLNFKKFRLLSTPFSQQVENSASQIMLFLSTPSRKALRGKGSGKPKNTVVVVAASSSSPLALLFRTKPNTHVDSFYPHSC